jgi:predicted MFS family arabinose efflux permease
MVLTTFGKFTFDPAMQAYLGDRVPYRRRGLTLAITELGWSGAFFLGVPAVGFLIARLGWLAPFPLLAVLSLIAMAILFWMLPSDSTPAPTSPILLRNFRAAFSSPAARAGLGVTFFISIAREVVNIVFGVWLEDSFGLQVAALGMASAVIGFAEVGGEGLVSVTVDRLGKRRSVAIGLVFISLASVLLPAIGRSIPGALVGLFMFYLSYEFTYVSSIPLMTEVLPEARATLMALNIAIASLGRAVAAWAAPPLYGAGFATSALAAALINLLALLALRRVVLPGESDG